MDEVIEVVLNSIIKKVEGFSYDEQSFIFSELAEQLTRLSHDALMAEYGMKEEDFVWKEIIHGFTPFLAVCQQ